MSIKKNPGKNHFHVNGFALSLTLKQRLEAYRFAYSFTRTLVARKIACVFSGFDQVFLRDRP